MKIIFFIIVVAFFIFIINQSKSNQYLCERCEGKGFWKGLRGERNHCKACDGAGFIQREIE